MEDSRQRLSHVVHFADICTRGECTWSLYMGPVYVMEDAHTAERGVEVGVVVPRTRRNMLGFTPLTHRNRRRSWVRRRDTVVRQLYIDDVNQLPVTIRATNDHDHLGLVTINVSISAGFEQFGATPLVEQTRAEWKRVAEEHRAAAAIAAGNAPVEPDTRDNKQAQDSTEAKEEAGEQDEEETGEAPRDATTPRHGPVIEYEYAMGLMTVWLNSLALSMEE